MSHTLLDRPTTEPDRAPASPVPYLAHSLTLAVVAIALLVSAVVLGSALLAVVAILATVTSVFVITYGQFHQVFTS